MGHERLQARPDPCGTEHYWIWYSLIGCFEVAKGIQGKDCRNNLQGEQKYFELKSLLFLCLFQINIFSHEPGQKHYTVSLSEKIKSHQSEKPPSLCPMSFVIIKIGKVLNDKHAQTRRWQSSNLANVRGEQTWWLTVIGLALRKIKRVIRDLNWSMSPENGTLGSRLLHSWSQTETKSHYSL